MLFLLYYNVESLRNREVTLTINYRLLSFNRPIGLHSYLYWHYWINWLLLSEEFVYSFVFPFTCSPMPLIIQIRGGLSLDFPKLLCHTLLTHGTISVLADQTKFTLVFDAITLSNIPINVNDKYLTIRIIIYATNFFVEQPQLP